MALGMMKGSEEKPCPGNLHSQRLPAFGAGNARVLHRRENFLEGLKESCISPWSPLAFPCARGQEARTSAPMRSRQLPQCQKGGDPGTRACACTHSVLPGSLVGRKPKPTVSCGQSQSPRMTVRPHPRAPGQWQLCSFLSSISMRFDRNTSLNTLSPNTTASKWAPLFCCMTILNPVESWANRPCRCSAHGSIS